MKRANQEGPKNEHQEKPIAFVPKYEPPQYEAKPVKNQQFEPKVLQRADVKPEPKIEPKP